MLLLTLKNTNKRKNVKFSGGEEDGVPAVSDQAGPESNHGPLQGIYLHQKMLKKKSQTLTHEGIRARDHLDGQCEKVFLPETLQRQPDLSLWSRS